MSRGWADGPLLKGTRQSTGTSQQRHSLWGLPLPGHAWGQGPRCLSVLSPPGLMRERQTPGEGGAAQGLGAGRAGTLKVSS